MEFKLLIKKINGTLTEKEAIIFDTWYHESALHREYYQKVKAAYKHNDKLYINVDQAYIDIQQKLQRKPKKRWRWAAVAVVIGVISVSTVLFWNDYKVETTPHSTPVAHQPTAIQHGTNKAILKKDDGTQIILEKGRNYEDSKVTSNGEYINYKKIECEKAIAYNTLEVPRGGVFTVTLADGTQIWLNSDSAIKYPVSFATTDIREVELLYGEAYFDVTPSSNNDGKDFRVISKNQTIQVLGTEFNVKAYQEENNIATTLVEGKVTLTTPLEKSKLLPGKQAIYHLESNKTEIKTVNIYDEISWKNGLFSFKNKPLKEIITVLSRWYDVDITIENQQAANTHFNGVFNKKQDLNQILLIIEKTNEAKFVTVGKSIILK